MAYFEQVKNYQLHLISRCLTKYEDIKSPFLEVGCGKGNFLLFLQNNGFEGLGIDTSPEAINAAKYLKLKNIKIKKMDFFNMKGKFDFILMIDVLEHIKHDNKALKKNYSLLNKKGYLIFQVPSHKRKYCWIDVNYGHFRRYDKEDIINIVKKANLTIKELWCNGFPFISLYGRFYLFYY